MTRRVLGSARNSRDCKATIDRCQRAVITHSESTRTYRDLLPLYFDCLTYLRGDDAANANV
jgi:hypothetical protein